MPVSAEKQAYAEKLNRLLDSYERILFVGVDNVRSEMLHQVRKDLRGKAELLMGKNTLQRRILTDRGDATIKEKLLDAGILTGNRGMLFTNASLQEITEVLKRHRIQAPARVGAVAPCDVIVPAGNTGMEPTQTSFFQALGIQTKISKGTVEITADKKVLSTGEKVDSSCAALLQKLNISPFFYECEVQYVWDRGVLFTQADLSITDDILEKELLAGINNLTAISLGAGVPTEVSFPHLVLDAFKDLLAITLETELSFTEFGGDKLKADIKSGKATAAAAAPAAAPAKGAAPAPAAKKAPEPEPEEEEDFGMGGLF
jgi:large subunit ribosomal protein LP0